MTMSLVGPRQRETEGRYGGAKDGGKEGGMDGTREGRVVKVDGIVILGKGKDDQRKIISR